MSTLSVRTTHPVVPLLGRLALGGLFVFFGIRSIMFFAGSVGYFGKLGFPSPEAMVVLAIVIQIGAGLALIAGWQTRWAAWTLVFYVLVAAFMAHRYWEVADAAQYGNQMQHFYKNMAIVGGLLMVAAFGPGSMSVDKS
jgi:putative oxidoreductase